MGHWYSCKLNSSHENIKESLLILSYWILSSLKSNSNNSNEPNESSIAEQYTHFELCDVIHFFRVIVKNFLQLLWNRRISSYVSEFTRFYLLSYHLASLSSHSSSNLTLLRFGQVDTPSLVDIWCSNTFAISFIRKRRFSLLVCIEQTSLSCT